MIRWQLAAVLVMIGLASRGIAQDQTPTPSQSADAQRVQELRELEIRYQRLAALQAEILVLERRLRTASTAPEIMLEVRVLETSLTRLSEAGIDAGGSLVNILRGHDSNHLSAAKDGESFPRQIVRESTDVNKQVQDLIRKGAVKVLAEPQLLTTAGRPVSFRSGGEFPVLIATREGLPQVDYKHFGTEVVFEPNVLPDGRLRIQAKLRLSQRVERDAATSESDLKLPELHVREANFDVRLKPEQTLVSGGFVETRTVVDESDEASPPNSLESKVRTALGRLGKPRTRVESIETIVLVTPRLAD